MNNDSSTQQVQDFDDLTPQQDDITSNIPLVSFTPPPIAVEPYNQSVIEAINSAPMDNLGPEKTASIKNIFG